jgi:hypothetical protein
MKRNGNKQITIPKGRKNIPLTTLSQSSIYTSTFWENHSKPVTNHLNLRLSTFFCFASQTVMCSSQRVKEPVEHEWVYPGKNMCSLPGQICSGRASKLALQ